MKKLTAAFLLMLSAIAADPASAVVIDFESTGTPNTYNSLNYAIDGFIFNFTMDNIDVSAGGPWGALGPAYSGSYAGLNNYGGAGEITRADGGTFTFNSLWIKNWFYTDDRVGQINGFVNGVQVASLGGISNGDWQQLTGNFTGIDKLEIAFGNYFLIDDIELDGVVSAVPEPATAMLLGLGLLGFAATRRTSVKTNNA